VGFLCTAIVLFFGVAIMVILCHLFWRRATGRSRIRFMRCANCSREVEVLWDMVNDEPETPKKCPRCGERLWNAVEQASEDHAPTAKGNG